MAAASMATRHTSLPDAPSAPGAAGADDAFLINGQGIESVAPGIWILRGQGNSVVFELGVGLVLVDAGPGGRVTAGMISALREVSDAPVHAICFSHGHLGYNGGLELWRAHAGSRGDVPPRCVAHANLPRRAARYQETMALQERMAEVQFRRNPTNLHPAPRPDADAAIANAITDKQAVIAQASALADRGSTQLALHVIDLLATLQCDSVEIARARGLKALWMRQRASETRSFISKSLFHAGAQMIEDGQSARLGFT